MDTQNDGLEKVAPFKYGPFLVSMLNFWGVNQLPSATLTRFPEVCWVMFLFNPTSKVGFCFTVPPAEVKVFGPPKIYPKIPNLKRYDWMSRASKRGRVFFCF